MSGHRVAVLIPAYKGDRWIGSCVDSLLATTDERVRILVIDNWGNAPSIADHHGREGRVEVVDAPGPLPFTEVNNHVLIHEQIDEPFVCFLNQDTVSTEPWLLRCLEAMEEDAGLGAVTPWMLAYEGEAADPAILDCLRGARPDAPPLRPSGGELVDAPAIPAAAMLVRRQLLQQVGPFDPIFRSYYEDYDLCDRIRADGARLAIVSAVAARHFQNSATETPAEHRDLRRLNLRNRALIRVRRSGARRLPALLRVHFVTFPRNLLRSLVRRRGASPLRSVLSAWWQVLVLSPRMVSQARDQGCFRDYLRRVGWGEAPEA